jgi:DNA (cytosine-5)-methyltransferase 1
MNKKAIKTLSLFSGAGGLDIGFREAAFEIVACVELEPAYCKTLETNAGRLGSAKHPSRIHCGDIKEFDPSPYVGVGIECVIGGPPCQTFSAAGRRSGGVLGTDDARGRLFQSYCRILDAVQPRVFVFENVYGLPGANNGGPWREICEAFFRRGYSLSAEVVDAADYGVPQHRERLIIVGYRDDVGPFVFPLPTHGPDSDTQIPLVGVGEVIADLQIEGETSSELGGLYGHLLPLVPEGLNYSFFTREMGYPKPFFAWRSKFSDFLYKADRSSPCRTLKAQPGKFTGPFHWNNRHFAVPELKRLQSFPDDYAIEGSFGKAMQQIGNSVPPRLAYVLAVSVRDQILRPVKNPTFKLRPEGFKSTFRQRQRDRTESYRSVAKQEIARKFPNVTFLERAVAAERKSQFFVGFEGFFNKTICDAQPPLQLGFTYFEVAEVRAGDTIELELTNVSVPVRNRHQVTIEITGLTKYLSDVEAVFCTAHVAGVDDLFKVWSIIERAITAESQFFTLIDIYGHYANRGDTVRIKTIFHKKRKSLIERAFEYFGRSENCGEFLPQQSVAELFGIRDEVLKSVISELRSVRWDVRSPLTHPTIRENSLLCTYPFPLLSDKAQLERRIKG